MLNRPRKGTTKAIDNDLKKVLEDYTETRVMYDTIELQHPSFQGQPGVHGTSYYLVNHTDNVTRNKIKYLNFPFSIQMPEVGSNQQTLMIALDNTDQMVQKGIEQAIKNPVPIKVIYRAFIEGSGDVKVGPIELQVETCTVKQDAVTLSCSRPDIYKRTFPGGVRYDSKFKGLMI